MRIFPVIMGPTASGKTALALRVGEGIAARTGAAVEIISADSMQVYSGMDIGTAKPGPEERGGFVHHAIDVREPDEPFTVRDWLELARGAIDGVRERGGTPLVVGGTHLYIKALLEGLSDAPAGDPGVRAELQALPVGELRAELARVDPEAAARIHPNDVRRTIRALEVHRATGRPLSAAQGQWDSGGRRPDALLVAIQWPTAELNQRINARVKAMMERGLLEEVRSLWEGGRLGTQAGEGLGYKQLLEALEGRSSLEDAVERIKIETRRFAKNQRTWMRRLAASPPAITLAAPEPHGGEWAQTIVDAVVTAS